MFGAVDIGGEIEVSNPFNWSDSEFDELPAPLLIDTENFQDYDSENNDVNEGVRRSNFSFLAVSKRANDAPLWAQRFRGANPTGATTTLAQAKVFNNTSWGLWTQEWQVQLTPIKKWEDWTEKIEDDVSQTPFTQGAVAENSLKEILEYLKALPPELVEKFIGH